MRIISKFRDYYDGVQIYGADPDLRYIRKKEEMDPEKDGKHLFAWHRHHACLPHDFRFPDDFYYVPMFILFCGKAYPVLEMGFRAGMVPPVYRYTFESARDFFTESGLIPPPSFSDKLPLPGSHYYTRVVDFFKSPLDIGPGLFIGHGAPIFVTRTNPNHWQPATIIKNPCLKDYGFAKIVDPNTAYQELSMFLGSVLTGTGNPMVAVDEKKRIEKRGFDKWSFRKPPTKRKIK